MADDEKNLSAGPYHKSKNLDPSEKEQAAQHAAPPAVVIHESFAKRARTSLSGGLARCSGRASRLASQWAFHSDARADPKRSSGRAMAAALRQLWLFFGLHHCRARATAALYRIDPHRRVASARPARLVGLDVPGALWAVVLSANILGTFLFARLLAIHGLFRSVARCARRGRSSLGRGRFLAEGDRGGARGLADCAHDLAFA